jgi:hypothetical protein
MSGSISRRAMLGGGVALGAAALLTKGQPASADPMKHAYGPALVGATFDLFPFKPDITTYPAAMGRWNKRTGTTMKCWKVYYQESKFPATLDAQLKTIISQGIVALVSFKPTPDIHSPQGRDDRSRLADAVALFKESKLKAQVCLWQEIRPRDMTAGQYKDLVEFYGPVVRGRNYPLVFDAAGYQGPKEWADYKPDDSLLDGYALDFYCGDYVHKGLRLDQFFPLAGDKPVGVWEIGNTASAQFTPSKTDVKNYMDHIRTKLTARLLSGLPVGSVAWYNGPADPKQHGGNEIAGTHPCQLAPTDVFYYKQLYAAINGKFPVSITS